MSFYSFVDLVEFSRFTFVRPKLWDDKYEGFIFQKLKKDDGIKEIASLIRKNQIGLNVEIFLSFADKYEKTFYSQCWTRNKESDAMWKSYNYENNAVKIEIDLSLLSKLSNVDYMEIEYYDSLNLEDELKRAGLLNNTINIAQMFKVKRTAFSHENEIRLYTIDNNALNDKSEEEIYQFKHGLLKANMGNVYNDILTRQSKDIKYIDIPDLSSNIISVQLHPNTADWFDKTVSEYCKKNKLNYIGKSRLYANP